jgi:hypothetical protein
MLYSNVDKALGNQLQVDVPKVYISTILNPVIGIGNATRIALLTHLHTTYGIITKAELDSNLNQIKNQWNPPTSTEIIFVQINVGVAFTTTGGDPQTGPSVICIA